MCISFWVFYLHFFRFFSKLSRTTLSKSTFFFFLPRRRQQHLSSFLLIFFSFNPDHRHPLVHGEATLARWAPLLRRFLRDADDQVELL